MVTKESTFQPSLFHLGEQEAAREAPAKGCNPKVTTSRDEAPEPILLSADERLLAAAVWLETRLQEPQRIADVFHEFCGSEHHADQKILDLNAAARFLGVESLIGNDDCFWWVLPAVTVKEAA